jgi:MerR family mercuric resistance operon transcriptional regulator
MESAARVAIGTLAKQTNTNVETIEFYERIGLLPATARSASRYRLYRIEHREAAAFRPARSGAGLLHRRHPPIATSRGRAQAPCAEVRIVAEAHLRDVRAKIADLRAMERVLTGDRDGGAMCDRTRHTVH